MKTLKVLFLLILSLFLLSGCYESKYPIAGTKEQVKPELIGNYIGENFPELKVIPISDTDYFILFSNKDGNVTIGKAYSLAIGNSNLMIFQELSSGKNNYWFFKYDCKKINNTYVMTARSISDNFIKLNPPKNQDELQQIITKNFENDIMFDEPQTFLKLINTDIKLSLYLPEKE
ncbi:MAG: hypothetical protein WCR55_13350 [Lentisphaerota bacterium]